MKGEKANQKINRNKIKNDRKIRGKSPNTLKLSYTLLNNPGVKEELPREILKIH